MSTIADAMRFRDELFNIIGSGGTTQEFAAVLNQGADVDFRDHNKVTPLNYAANQCRMDIVELLVMRGAKIDQDRPILSPLFDSVLTNDTELVSFLLRHKAQVNARNHINNTPLHLAAGIFNRVEAARLLLENKADYTLKNDEFWTPMQEYGITDEMRQLILDQKDKEMEKCKDRESEGEISKPKIGL